MCQGSSLESLWKECVKKGRIGRGALEGGEG